MALSMASSGVDGKVNLSLNHVETVTNGIVGLLNVVYNVNKNNVVVILRMWRVS